MGYSDSYWSYVAVNGVREQLLELLGQLVLELEGCYLMDEAVIVLQE